MEIPQAEWINIRKDYKAAIYAIYGRVDIDISDRESKRIVNYTFDHPDEFPHYFNYLVKRRMKLNDT